MSGGRRSSAERSAQDLLREHGVTAPPVPVEAIARLVGAQLHWQPLEGELSAILYRDPQGQATIGVNALHPQRRQRFSIAHEIGHLRLHPDTLFVDGLVRRDARSSLAVDPKEIQANAFAAELLMPRSLVVEEIDRRLPRQSGTVGELRRLVRELAETFEVSEQAMEIRLANLGFVTSF